MSLTSCSGRIIKDKPADMYINCSAFSAFIISSGFMVEGSKAAEAAAFFPVGLLLAVSLAAVASVLEAAEGAVLLGAGVAPLGATPPVTMIISVLSLEASFFSMVFSRLSRSICCSSSSDAFDGSVKMRVKTSAVEAGGVKQTRYLSYTRSVKATRNCRVCSKAECNRRRASSRHVSEPTTKEPYLSVNGARSLLSFSSNKACSSIIIVAGG